MATTILKVLFSKASARVGLYEDLTSRRGKEFQLYFHLLYGCDIEPHLDISFWTQTQLNPEYIRKTFEINPGV
jgi:hypothetical protein